jgi:L-ribulose-5-phosphate 3-epimerase
MRIAGYDIGVCSWSLAPAITAAITRARRLGFRHMQVHLNPLMFLDDEERIEQRSIIARSRMILTAGMLSFPGEDYTTIDTIRATGGITPDEDWPIRKLIAHQGASIANDMGLRQISFHAGFIPSHMDDQHARIATRIREIALIFADYGIDLLLETGQEYPDALAQFLDSLACPNVYVNFDPANMIMYGAGDPIDAIEILGSRIRHVHIKDALASDAPGETWGKEVPFGLGEVSPGDFLDALRTVDYNGYLTIEREGNADWRNDIPQALNALRAIDDGESFGEEESGEGDSK